MGIGVSPGDTIAYVVCDRCHTHMMLARVPEDAPDNLAYATRWRRKSEVIQMMKESFGWGFRNRRLLCTDCLKGAQDVA